MKKRKAISAILGTAIALVIVFTVFIPLIMYVQSLQTIFMQEANRRLQYELERIHEKLDVHISITPSEEVYPNHYFWIIIYNPGILTVSIPTIYIETHGRGIIEIPEQFLIAPGETIRYEVRNFYLSPGDIDIVRVKVVTLRGNNFISKERLGPVNLPYHLIITVSNMTFGHEYEILVEKLPIYRYGCVQANPSEPCDFKKSISAVPQSYNDTLRMVVFKVAPGEYRVTVRDKVGNSIIRSENSEVEVYDDMILNIQLPSIDPPRIAPLGIYAINKNLMIVVSGTGMEVKVPYLVSLRPFGESLIDIDIEIECDGEGGDEGQHKINKIYPGETYFGNFTIPLSGDVPGKMIYKIRISSATGEISRVEYFGSTESDYRIEKYEDTGEIIFCVLRTITIEGGTDTEIRYVECPSS